MTTFFLDFENGADATFDASPDRRNGLFVGTNPVILTTRPKFGTYSLYNGGNGGNGIVFTTSTGFQFGSGQFTIEAWVNFSAHTPTSPEVIVGNFGGSSILGFDLLWSATNQLTFAYSLSGTDSFSISATAASPTLNQWYHVAVDRDAANVIRLYLDGAVVASATVASALFASTRDLYVGNDGNVVRFFPGYIGGVRITKGVARYAGAFTPPTAAFPENSAGDAFYANNTLLLNFNSNGDGLSFQNRWKTIATGATATRIAPGDTIRIMGSPDPTLVGSALWTQYSKNVVLASAVTANICDCEAAWVTSTNVTQTNNTSTFKEGTKSIQLTLAAAFTTGKVAYFATGTLDLSAYQQVSFWVQNTGIVIAANTLSLRLCTDTAGAVSVHTIPIPAIASGGQWVPVTVDLGTNLNSTIQSIALYQDVDIAAVVLNFDNIIACKASSDPASLTLTSLIGKVCNLSWTASTARTVGEQRKPTQPNRNGFRYQVTVAGTTGPTEPAWPQEIGVTVTDGSVTWSCVDLEDSWFGIQSINGTTVKLDNNVNNAGNAGRGYAGATETVATYKRETIKTSMASAAATTIQTLQKSGTDALPITYSGGWNRADMSTLSGETWLDGQNGNGYAITTAATITYTILKNLNGVRYNVGFYEWGLGTSLYNLHWNNCSTYAFLWSSAIPTGMGVGVQASNGGTSGVQGVNAGYLTFRQSAFESHITNGINLNSGYRLALTGTNLNLRNNGSYGGSMLTTGEVVLRNAVTGNNGNAGYQFNSINSSAFKATLHNCLIPESTPFVALSANGGDQYLYSQKHNQIADNHFIQTDGGTIVSAIDQRHSPTGIAWKFRPTSTSRNSVYPLKLSIAKIACTANNPVSVAIWTRRDNANIKGQLFLAGGQIAGVPQDVVINCQPTVNIYEPSDTLTFTPTESGVVEVQFRVWDGVGTTNNFWIDDLSLSAIAAPVSTTYAIWNLMDSTSAVALDSTRTQAAAGVNSTQGIRATVGKSSGKMYFEYTTIFMAGGSSGCGVADSTAALSTMGNTISHAALYENTGVVWINGSNRFNIGAFTQGAVIRVAVDLDNRRIWFAKNGGAWNGSGTANPATPSTGFDLSSVSIDTTLYPAVSFNTISDQINANFGQSAFTYAVPTGFTAGWPV